MIEGWLESRVQAKAHAFLAIRELETVWPRLPNVAPLTEVKEDLHLMYSTTLQAIDDDQLSHLFVQAQGTPMEDRIRQPLIPIMGPLYRG
jgi:hypothetical protein